MSLNIEFDATNMIFLFIIIQSRSTNITTKLNFKTKFFIDIFCYIANMVLISIIICGHLKSLDPFTI